jgi:hypothetical protein
MKPFSEHSPLHHPQKNKAQISLLIDMNTETKPSKGTSVEIGKNRTTHPSINTSIPLPCVPRLCND